MEQGTNSASATPEPDALSPEALRGEIINIIANEYIAVSTSRQKAENSADKVLLKLAEYYAAVATPESVAEAPQMFAIIQALVHAVDRTIGAGAVLSSAAQLPADRIKWQEAAANLRASLAQLVETLA